MSREMNPCVQSARALCMSWTVSILALCAFPSIPGLTRAEGPEPAGSIVPTPGPGGWGVDDEIGNANTMGRGTRLRCLPHMIKQDAKVYELGHEFSETMPFSPFGDAPVDFEFTPTNGVPFTKHAFNGEILTAGIGSQGTQMDALGHFGALDQIWDPFAGPLPSGTATYYNGFQQSQVKPSADSPLLKLGIEKVPPIITSAVVLDAKEYLGRPMVAGEFITAEDIEAMLVQQGISARGILPGDAVYIRTGWAEKWTDPSPIPSATEYYAEGPGLAVSAVQYLAQRTVVLVALDNPFTDPVLECQLDGSCPPTEGTLPGLPFSVHHLNLAVFGIYQMQNLSLTEIADDDVNVACTIVLPLRLRGASGSTVRPIAIGAP